MIHLDTHVVAWLHVGETWRLPQLAQKLIEGNSLSISPMVALELQYLYEIGRRRTPASEALAHLSERLGLKMAISPFPAVIERATQISWTRDPFDRLLVAQALVEGCVLLTRDEKILANCQQAKWDQDSR